MCINRTWHKHSIIFRWIKFWLSEGMWNTQKAFERFEYLISNNHACCLTSSLDNNFSLLKNHFIVICSMIAVFAK